MKAKWNAFQTSRFDVHNNPCRPKGATDDWCWSFLWRRDGWTISNSNGGFPTREAALEDARAHGITWEE